MNINCPKCKCLLECPEELINEKIECINCGFEFIPDQILNNKKISFFKKFNIFKKSNEEKSNRFYYIYLLLGIFTGGLGTHFFYAKKHKLAIFCILTFCFGFPIIYGVSNKIFDIYYQSKFEKNKNNIKIKYDNELNEKIISVKKENENKINELKNLISCKENKLNNLNQSLTKLNNKKNNLDLKIKNIENQNYKTFINLYRINDNKIALIYRKYHNYRSLLEKEAKIERDLGNKMPIAGYPESQQYKKLSYELSKIKKDIDDVNNLLAIKLIILYLQKNNIKALTPDDRRWLFSYVDNENLYSIEPYSQYKIKFEVHSIDGSGKQKIWNNIDKIIKQYNLYHDNTQIQNLKNELSTIIIEIKNLEYNIDIIKDENSFKNRLDYIIKSENDIVKKLTYLSNDEYDKFIITYYFELKTEKVKSHNKFMIGLFIMYELFILCSLLFKNDSDGKRMIY